MAIIWVGTGRFNAYIGPVEDYIDRVVAADEAAGNTLGLEVGVRDAYDVFIRDSIDVGDLGTSGGELSQANSIIKAAPIMAGARTMAGALVPLVGPAPTAFGSAGGWNYNRETGLAGNGIDNYLNSNRNNNADPQNNFHALTRVTSFGSTPSDSSVTFGAGGGSTGRTIIARTVATCRSTIASNSFIPSAPTAIAISRTASAQFTVRVNAANNVVNVISETPGANSFYLFARENGSGSPELFTDCRLAFYSIGESLNLALLDTRVTALMTAIGAAIP